jgi:hypothetical protein
MIFVTIAGSAPRQIQTLDPSTSNSIECGRASIVGVLSPASSNETPLGASRTTGANVDASIS